MRAVACRLAKAVRLIRRSVVGPWWRSSGYFKSLGCRPHSSPAPFGATLPLGAVGARGIKSDVLGHTVRWTKLDENHVTLTLNPGEGLFLELEMKD